jgi:hypothetical protein
MRRTLLGLAIAVATMAPGWARASEADDKAAAKHIAGVLRDSGRMQGYSVGVKYKDGTVWLAGRVTSKEQMQAALQIVSDTEGVEQIVNNMTVGAAQSNAAKPVPLAAARAGVRQASATAGAVQQASPTPRQNAPRPAARRGAPAGYNQLESPEVVQEGVQGGMPGRPIPSYAPGVGGGGTPVCYDKPHMPNYAWPSYAAAPNYAALTYPKQYAASAFPFIGPFYPYPQVPLGWRKVSLEWDDGWWFLDFEDRNHH